MVATAAALPSGAVLASAKKRAAAKAKKKTVATKKKPASSRVQKVHPRTAELVDSAIAALGDRGGSSLADIKKYISATYGVDAEKLTPLIKKALAGKVVGSPGAFKLDAKPTPKKRSAVKKTVKKSPAKKKASPKKKVARKSLGAKPPKPKAAKKKTAGKKKAGGKKAARK